MKGINYRNNNPEGKGIFIMQMEIDMKVILEIIKEKVKLFIIMQMVIEEWVII